jgi:hypothetical protein
VPELVAKIGHCGGRPFGHGLHRTIWQIPDGSYDSTAGRGADSKVPVANALDSAFDDEPPRYRHPNLHSTKIAQAETAEEALNYLRICFTPT